MVRGDQPWCVWKHRFAEPDMIVNDKCALFAEHARLAGGGHRPFPRSMVVDGNARLAQSFVADSPDGAFWVVKEPRVERQEGVHLARRDDVPDALARAGEEPLLLQRFVTNPLTLPGPDGRGHKFTLRCYVAVHRPGAAVYMHERGKIYHCSEPYENQTRAAMVTSGYLPPEAIAAFPYTFEQLWELCGDDVYAKAWGSVVRAVGTLAPTLLAMLQGVGVEDVCETYRVLLLGLDVELDGDLEAWVLECNVGPDMAYKNEADERLKTKVSDDLIDLAAKGAADPDSNGFFRV